VSVAKLKPGTGTYIFIIQKNFVYMFRRIWPSIEELNVKLPVDTTIPRVLRGGAVGGASLLQAVRLRVRFPKVLLI
jgi:hypothetical protein